MEQNTFLNEQPHNGETLLIDERVLTEVDNINQFRQTDGTLLPDDKRDIIQNLTTAAQEAAMPHAVTRTEHEQVYDPERQKFTYRWLGRSAVAAAHSGYEFHSHNSAHARVGIEIDEAQHAEDNLEPGIMHVFISPRMTRADATLRQARHEHLGDDDAVRASWIETDAMGNPKKRVLESLLVRNVPLDAWQAMLQDPENPFGKAVELENEESAMSVMQVHRELSLPLGKLPEGPVSIVEAVVPYIEDPEARTSVMEQLELYKCDQKDLHKKAEVIAGRWFEFEDELEKSLKASQATDVIKQYILSLQHYWDDTALDFIESHHISDGQYAMTRPLAALLEEAKRKNLWTIAAVVGENKEVIRQMSPQAREQILSNEYFIELARLNDMDSSDLEAKNNQLTARQEVKLGGRGCPGDTNNHFRSEDNDGNDKNSSSPKREAESKEENWKDKKERWKKGICRIPSCSTRPGETKIGPCSVCSRCQIKFDLGADPTKEITFRVPKASTIKAKQEEFAVAA